MECEQSVAGLLEARLPERIAAPVSVVNTGVGGWDPPQYLLQVRALLSRRRFDLVVLLCVPGQRGGAQTTRPIPTPSPNGSIPAAIPHEPGSERTRARTGVNPLLQLARGCAWARVRDCESGGDPRGRIVPVAP